MVLARSKDRFMPNGLLKTVWATTPVKKLKSFKSYSSHTFVQTICKTMQIIVVFVSNALKLHDFKQILDALNRSSHEKRQVGPNGNHDNAPKRYLFC